ncbi:glycosyltransferase family 1 protein [Aquicoccus sp.]|uniref:glycosyltransferase family 1 protein n=1 Tax=Aquicoccus sp. TaxID=2055851 RepID=UPI003569D90C
METYDCLVVAESRFAGGSTAALVTDVTAMSELGLSIGLLFVRSAYLDDSRDAPNPKALELADLPGVTMLSPSRPARGRLAFLHHPLVFVRGIEERAHLSADRSVIVAHHPPFRPDGSVEYNPMEAIRRARAALGLSAWIAPVSGLVRTQIAAFAPFVRQTSIDWPNVFDISDWTMTRPPFSGGGPVTIGRHGRPDRLKFPATGPEIDACLPACPELRVRVLGCPTAALAQDGAHPEHWDIVAFGGEPVSDFLNSLDVFVYHHHPRINEAFGRTVVEAGLCGRPLLLDPRLRPTFGDMAVYCSPGEVRDCVLRIASDPDAARAGASEVRRRMATLYASGSIGPRLDQIAADGGATSRREAGVSLPMLARKLGGHYRRRLLGGTG